jgi:hypothetical protein
MMTVPIMRQPSVKRIAPTPRSHGALHSGQMAAANNDGPRALRRAQERLDGDR